MLDVLFINGCDLPHPSRYRVFHQIEQLQNFDVKVDSVHYMELKIDQVNQAKKFIFFRCPITNIVNEFIDKAHQQNKLCYFDCDDLVIDTKYTDKLSFLKSFSDKERQLFDDGVIRIGKTLLKCDCAIASTNILKEEFLHYVPRAIINRNVASNEMYQISKNIKNMKDSNFVTIGYFSGTITHNNDFDLIVDALINVLNKYKNSRLLITGVGKLPDKLKDFNNQIIKKEFVDWKKLPQLIASVDINIVPLEDNIFNQAKSENKWIDASLVKVPTVASDVGPFSDMIINNTTGILCKTSDDWIAALTKLITSKEERLNIGNQAYSYCIKHCITKNSGYSLYCEVTDNMHSVKDLISKDYTNSHQGLNRLISEYDVDVPEIKVFDNDVLGFINRKNFILDVDKRKKIAVLLYERKCGDNPTFRYFGINVAEAINKYSDNWHAEIFYTDEVDKLDEVISIADLGVLIRMRQHPNEHIFVKKMHDNHKPVAYLIDDNCVGRETAKYIYDSLNLAEDNDFERNFWLGVTKRFDYAAQECDCCIAPVQPLANILHKKYQKPSYVIHSSVNFSQLKISKLVSDIKNNNLDRQKHAFTVGYFSGTSSHLGDWKLIEKSVVDFIKTTDSRLILCGKMCITPLLYELYLDQKLVLLPFLDYSTLQLVQAFMDVVLAPLIKNDFTDCKSALKVYEAGLVKTPALCSNVFSYKEFVGNNENGLICNNDKEWLNNLRYIYKNRKFLLEIGNKAHIKTINDYSPKSLCSESVQVFEKILKIKSVGRYIANTNTLRQISFSDCDWNDQIKINTIYSRSEFPSTGLITDSNKRSVKRNLGKLIFIAKKQGIFNSVKAGTMLFSDLSLSKFNVGKKFTRKVKNRFSTLQNPQKISFCDVLFINGCDFALPHPIRYRIDHQVEQLEAQGLRCQIINAWELELKHVTNARNFIIFRAPYTDELGDFIKLAKSLNKKIYFDIDDLVIDTKYTNQIPAIADMDDNEKKLYNDGINRYRNTLKACGRCITTTKAMHDELLNYVDEVFINRNIASMNMVRYSNAALDNFSKNDDFIRIGYFSGSTTHDADLCMIMPALTKIMKKHKNVVLRFVGEIEIPKPLKQFENRIEFKKFLSWKQLPMLIAEVDINIAPLTNTIFNAAKSENKWTEASLVQVPTVASNIGAFAEIINNGLTGILCDTADDWFDALNSLIIDHDKRNKIALNAFNEVNKNHTSLNCSSNLASYIKNNQTPNIMFVLPAIDNTGGVMVAIKHMMILQDAGYDVMIGDNGQTTNTYFHHVEDHIIPVKYVYSQINCTDKMLMLGKIDNVVATIWFTTGAKDAIPNFKRFFYLVQGYEPDLYKPGTDENLGAYKSYNFNDVKYLTISKWCEKWLLNKFNQKCRYAPNGIDLKLFPYKKRNFDKPKINILIEGDCNAAHKNVDEAFKIVEKLDTDKFEISYLSYGGTKKDWYRADKFYANIAHDQVYKIYQSCDILLKTSLLESFSYPPLEMMATGGFVVAIKNDGNAEYLEDEYNCLFYNQGNINDAIKCIYKLLNNKILREKLIKNALNTVKTRDWNFLKDKILNLYE